MVQNDGLPEPAEGAEEAGPTRSEGCFRLTARVPLPTSGAPTVFEDVAA
ncbi:hypothetical protein NKH18_27650 [Streptomyces sp. M10(2022)]